MTITTALYRLARLSADARSLRSPQTAVRRAKNKIVGRVMARLLWRIWR